MFQNLRFSAVVQGLSFAACLAYAAQAAKASDTINLQTGCHIGDSAHVDVSLEVGGDLKVKQASGIGTVPTKVMARVRYDEQLLKLGDGEKKLRQSLRRYEQADANLTINTQTLSPKLRDDRKLIGMNLLGNQQQAFSPEGPLTRDEIDVIDMPANSLVVDLLLPGKAVSEGESWSHSGQTLAMLLGLDAVDRAEVTSTLEKITPEGGRLRIDGTLTGAIGGVSTEIELKGKYLFDSRHKRVTAMLLAIQEKRAIGHAGPGLDIVAKLKMQIEPAKGESKSLASKLPADALDPKSAMTGVLWESKVGGYRLTHDRRWFVLNEAEGVAVFRYVERGELVAQCNVSAMKTFAAGETLTLDGFQNDVKLALGKNFSEFASATESDTDTGLHMLRVAAVGAVDQLPIQWIYYHVSDRDGRRVVFAVTLESSLIGQFADSDRAFAASLEIRPIEELASKPTTTATKK